MTLRHWVTCSCIFSGGTFRGRFWTEKLYDWIWQQFCVSQGLKADTLKERYQKIGDTKRATPIEVTICKLSIF